MRFEKFFPNSDGLQNLVGNFLVKLFAHQECGYFEQELFGGNLRVKREFNMKREVFEKIEAVVKNFFILDAESFRDCIQCMFGPG